MEPETDRFGIVTADTIVDGVATDAYFRRTEETLDYLSLDPHVVAEVTADQFEDGTEEVEE